MTLREFLALVLPGTGDFYIAKLTAKKRFIQKKATSIDEAINQIHTYKTERVDTYFATASFDGERKTKDVKAKRAWYADIDCKETGQYGTKKEAVEAIKAALKSGLPRPTIITDSGHGYHLYWVVDSDVTKAIWKPVANGLVALCAQHKLNIDKGITIDAARLLRVPETSNFKDPDHPLPCKIVSNTGRVYTIEEMQEQTRVAQLSVVHTDFAGAADADDLSAGIQPLYDGKPPSAEPMLKGCPLFRSNLANHGADTPGEIWHKLIHTLAFTSDGHDYIHEISKGHTDYTPHKTEARWAYAVESSKRQGMGATKCQRFADSGAEQCKTCPILAQNKSPISLSFKQTHDPELPMPFRNGPTGLEVYDRDMEAWEPVYPAKLTALDASLEIGVGTFLEFKLGDRLIQFELSSMSDFRSFFVVLSEYGIHIQRWQYERFDLLAHTFLAQLHQARSLRRAIRAYGWVADGFHYGGVVFGSKDTHHAIRIDPILEEVYRVKGDSAIWTECANHILGQDRPSSWTIIASSFAAPLLGFTGASGAVISLVSAESGTGKTTVLSTAQAVWGHPVNGVAHLNDTANAVEERLGTLNNLPAFWDEVRGQDDTDTFIRTIFRLVQGQGKKRLYSTIKQRKAGQWATLMAVATNESLRDHITHKIGNSDAGAARVFELTAPKIMDKTMSDGKARAFYGRLKENYGGIGLAYAEYLGYNKEAVKERVAEIDDKLCRQLNSTSDERYWVIIIAVLLVGAEIATKQGWADFPMKKLTAYLIKQFKMHREDKALEYDGSTNHAVRAVSRFLHEQADYTVKSDIMPAKGGVQANAVCTPSNRQPVVVRKATRTNQIRFILEDFNNWFYKTHGAGAGQIVKDLVALGAERIRGSVDVGTPMATGLRHRCLQITVTSSPTDPFHDLDFSSESEHEG